VVWVKKGGFSKGWTICSLVMESIFVVKVEKGTRV